MGEDERRHAEGQADEREERHEHHAQDDLGDHDGKHGHIFHGTFGAKLHLGEAVSTQRADDRRAEAGAQRQNDAVAQRLEHGGVPEQRFVPFERKAAPHRADLAFVERIDDNEHDGQIQNGRDNADIDVGQFCTVFHKMPSSSVVCVTRLYSEIIRLVRIISTTLSAAAKGRLCVLFTWS